MIDTHTHIFDSSFDSDRAMVVQRAMEGGVERMILPAIDSQSHGALIDVVRDFPAVCFGAIGLHPTSVNDNEHWMRELDVVEQMIGLRVVEWVAVGEIGLDLYWSRDFFEEQLTAFNRQMAMAARCNLPVIIHTRGAWDEMMAAVRPYVGLVRGVFHSFSGDLRHMEEILAMDGFLVGVGGVATYKKSVLPDLIAHCPLERIVLETDSPYLPPVPYRGKRNESSYLGLIAEKIAQIKNMDIDSVKKITTDNAQRLFFV